MAEPISSTGAAEVRRMRGWKRVIRLLQVLLAVVAGLAVWLIGFGGDDGPAPVIPDTDPQFSLDLDVVATADHGVVYVVEQRARPDYRIFSFDPATGEATTIFTVPEGAIIYGLALSPDRQTLAVGYTTAFEVGGNGLWTLDVASHEFSQVLTPDEDVYLTELEWQSDGQSVLATEVDRTGSHEVLSIAEIDLESGLKTTAIFDGITPAVAGDAVFFLAVGEDSARRSVARLDESGTRETVAFDGSDLDLDHLVAAPGQSSPYVAVLGIEDSPGVTIGDEAEAHGNHDVPSTWWAVPPGSAEPTPQPAEPTVVYDASLTSDAIVYATREGLSIVSLDDGLKVDLIESRAIRLLAG